jgi:hypothetical protein
VVPVSAIPNVLSAKVGGDRLLLVDILL